VMRRVMRTLMYYPLVFFMSWMPSTLYRVAEMVTITCHFNLNLNFEQLFHSRCCRRRRCCRCCRHC
jgi:hypothetical protein